MTRQLKFWSSLAALHVLIMWFFLQHNARSHSSKIVVAELITPTIERPHTAPDTSITNNAHSTQQAVTPKTQHIPLTEHRPTYASTAKHHIPSQPSSNRPPTTSLNSPQNHTTPTTTQPSHLGGYLHNPQPPYPIISKEQGEQGRVTLSVHVQTDGHPASVQVVRSSNHPRLDQAAQRTVATQYRFTPATQLGIAVAAQYQFDIVFTLTP